MLSTYCFPLDLSLLSITLVFIRLHSASIGGNVAIELNLCDLDWLDYPKSHDHLEVVHLRFAISRHHFVSFLVPLQDILCASDQETKWSASPTALLLLYPNKIHVSLHVSEQWR